jgi:hypothetical protein
MGQLDIYVATRTTTSMPFGAASPVAIVNSAANERSPEIAASGLELYFDRAGILFVSTRPNTAAAWNAPTQVTLTGTIKTVVSPSLTADGLIMYFTQAGATSCGADGACVKRITRSAIGQPWSAVPDAPEPMGGLKYNDVDISSSGLSIVLCARSADSFSVAVESTRASLGSNFTVFNTIVNLMDSGTQGCAWNVNETELYMSIDKGTGDDLYVSVRQ